MRSFCAVVAALGMLCSCGGGDTPPKSAIQAVQPKKAPPPDESRLLPQEGLVTTNVVDTGLAGKPFMPGGTIGQYKKGEMFLARLSSPTEAALLLLDWKKAMPDAKLVPSFGGYSGTDNGIPTFVFTKGDRIAGVRGLTGREADLAARTLASRIP